MFKRQWLTFKLSTLFLIVSAAAVLFGYPHIRRQIQFHRFQAYVGQDIRNLPESERESFSAIVNDLVPDQPRGVRALIDGRENWFVWHLSTEDGMRFVLFQGDPIKDIPGNSGAYIYLFDARGRLVGQSSFSTGYRMDITDAAIVSDEIKGESLIAVSTGPAFGREDIAKEYYAFLGDNVVLVRLEDKTGAFVGNDYCSSHHTIGPATMARTDGEWIEALKSSDPVEMLRTLTWLGGKHNSPWRAPGEESLQVRNHPDIASAVDVLTRNPHPWVSEAALQVQRSLHVHP